MDPADREDEAAWAGVGLLDWEDDVVEEVEICPVDPGAMRRALGVDSIYGFHVVAPRDEGADRTMPCVATPPAAAQVEGIASFPCISDHRYSGCLGLACPLDTCWTGGATVSFARRQSESSRISGALYLPGAPCHSCAHLSEDEIDVPRPWRGRPSNNGRSRDHGAGGKAGDHAEGAEGPARLRRIVCSEGLWAHPISLPAFLARRIPMLNQDDPANCPCYERRAEPHPEVEAHLRLRRERTRRRRADEREDP
jgi:hypothetical protein